MLHRFGLGSSARVERVRIQWPDGSVEPLAGLETNGSVTVRQDGYRFNPPLAVLSVSARRAQVECDRRLPVPVEAQDCITRHEPDPAFEVGSHQGQARHAGSHHLGVQARVVQVDPHQLAAPCRTRARWIQGKRSDERCFERSFPHPADTRVRLRLSRSRTRRLPKRPLPGSTPTRQPQPRLKQSPRL